MTRVFISYRRDDSAEAAERLDATLKERYGATRVFRDTRSIPAGAAFSSELELQLLLADVVLGVIGPTRMQYGRAIAVVRYMARVMNELLAEMYGYDDL